MKPYLNNVLAINMFLILLPILPVANFKGSISLMIEPGLYIEIEDL